MLKTDPKYEIEDLRNRVAREVMPRLLHDLASSCVDAPLATKDRKYIEVDKEGTNGWLEGTLSDGTYFMWNMPNLNDFYVCDGEITGREFELFPEPKDLIHAFPEHVELISNQLETIVTYAIGNLGHVYAVKKHKKIFDTGLKAF